MVSARTSFRSGTTAIARGLTAMLLLGSIGGPAMGQTVTEPGFENGGSGWAGCPAAIWPWDISANGGGGHVGALTGSGEGMTALCQQIGGFTVGEEYRLGFEAARWMPDNALPTASAAVYLDGTLLAVFTTAGDLEMQHNELRFVAAAPAIELRFEPVVVGAGAVLVDDLTLRAENRLPIELDSYTASVLEHTVDVEWITATEDGNAYFEVERSTDLLDWVPVGSVPAMGESQAPLHYRVTDDRPVRGTNYYHLKQIGDDGSVDVSQAISVFFEGGEGTPAFWPNPAVDEVRMAFSGASNGTFRVIDASGRTMHVVQLQEQAALRFDLSALQPGAYVVQDLGNGRSVGRFVKQ